MLTARIDRYITGSPSGGPTFHFAGSGENLLDIAKSRDASMDNKELDSFLY